MSLNSWLLFLHILGAMVWLGGGATLAVAGLQAWRGGDITAIRPLARLLGYLGLRMMMPAVTVVITTGIWLVLASTEWRFSEPWILVGLGMFALAFLVGALYLSRVAIRLERAAAASGADATALLGRWLIGYALVLVILLVAVWDMVFKPGS